jgi:hypothetical protein
MRSYPRVIKRRTVGDKLIKRSHHTQTIHTAPPALKIGIYQIN